MKKRGKRKKGKNKYIYGLQKPVFGKIFAGKLIGFLVLAVLLAWVGTRVAITYYLREREQGFQMSFEMAKSNIENIFEELGEKEIKTGDSGTSGGLLPSGSGDLATNDRIETALRWTLIAINSHEEYHGSFALFDSNLEKELANTEGMAFILWPGIHGEFYRCPYADMAEVAEDYSKYGEDENVEVRIKDFYIKDYQFWPGKVFLVKTIPGKGEEVIREYDYTPDDITDYTRITDEEGVGPFMWGKGDDIRARTRILQLVEEAKSSGGDRQAVETQGTAWYTFGGIEILSGEKISVADKTYYLEGAVHYNIFEDYGWQICLIYGFLLLAAIIVSFIIAYRAFTVEQGHYRMERYRRDTANAMAHDLKTPLTAISGYAESLKENIRPEKRDYYVDAIYENAMYMNRLVGNILDLAKIENRAGAPELTEVSLREITKEALKKYALLAEERGITFELEGNAVVEADEGMAVQIVENLISNCVKYAEAKKAVTIKMSDKSYEVCNVVEEEPEIPAGELWKPFVKGSNSRTGNQGTGIGLTIVKNLAEINGFSLTLSCEDKEFRAVLKQS